MLAGRCCVEPSDSDVNARGAPTERAVAAAGADTGEQAFDILLAARGIEVPAERRSGTLAAYCELAGLAERLRQPRNAESEPANIFSLTAILRGE
jgi:hypothetical protein